MGFAFALSLCVNLEWRIIKSIQTTPFNQSKSTFCPKHERKMSVKNAYDSDESIEEQIGSEMESTTEEDYIGEEMSEESYEEYEPVESQATTVSSDLLQPAVMNQKDLRTQRINFECPYSYAELVKNPDLAVIKAPRNCVQRFLGTRVKDNGEVEVVGDPKRIIIKDAKIVNTIMTRNGKIGVRVGAMNPSQELHSASDKGVSHILLPGVNQVCTELELNKEPISAVRFAFFSSARDPSDYVTKIKGKGLHSIPVDSPVAKYIDANLDNIEGQFPKEKYLRSKRTAEQDGEDLVHVDSKLVEHAVKKVTAMNEKIQKEHCATVGELYVQFVPLTAKGWDDFALSSDAATNKMLQKRALHNKEPISATVEYTYLVKDKLQQ